MSLLNPNAPPNPNGKAITMTMLVPEVEEPVIWIMVAGCKSGQVYVGHQPGQERGAFKLCLQGADTLHTVAKAQLEATEKNSLIAVPPSFRLPQGTS